MDVNTQKLPVNIDPVEVDIHDILDKTAGKLLAAIGRLYALFEYVIIGQKGPAAKQDNALRALDIFELLQPELGVLVLVVDL